MTRPTKKIHERDFSDAVDAILGKTRQNKRLIRRHDIMTAFAIFFWYAATPEKKRDAVKFAKNLR